MPRRKISCFLIVCNEADRIEASLKPLAGWVDQLIVLDSGSTDGTVEIAQQYADVVYQTDWPGLGPQRNRALSYCEHDWVLTMDADEVITELAKAHPQDLEVLQLSKNMTARVTMAQGGYDKVTAGEADYREVLKDEAEAILLEQENRRSEQESTAESLIREYEGRLQDDPENLKLIRSLAELYNRKKEFDKSIEYYELFNKTNLRSESAVDRAIVHTKLRRYDHQIESVSGEEADKLTEERKAFEIEQIQKLSETYPSDLTLRFELGVLQFESGDVQSAIRSFQRAQGNPHKEIAALTYLGQCFSKRGMNDMAARTLQNALDKKEVMDDEKMDLLYQLGCVLDSMDKKEESIEQFKQIYERDIGYKDVADRVDAYYMSLG